MLSIFSLANVNVVPLIVGENSIDNQEQTIQTSLGTRQRMKTKKTNTHSTDNDKDSSTGRSKAKRE